MRRTVESIIKDFADGKTEVIDLSGFQMNEIPEEIFNFTNLKYLILDDNLITSIPEKIKALRKLRILSARHNLIIDISEGFGELIHLERVYLAHNGISELPKSIDGLISLKKIDISFNQINKLPDSLSNIINLRELLLHNNQLSYIPIQLFNLTNLISNNISLYNKGLTLDNNKLPIGREVYSLEPKDIINEILRVQLASERGAAMKVNEGKIIFIGESNVGKTHLVEYLINKKITREISTTHGVEKRQIIFSSDESEIKGNIWDLGGQEFMRNTHQFFFTESTLYVLVTLARRERNEINYWLQLVKILGNNASVVIVIHQTDQDSHDLDRASLQRDYPNIIGFERTSIHDSSSITSLYGRIEEVLQDPIAMPGIHQLRPPEWFNVKSELEALSSDFISYGEYEKICETYAPDLDHQGRKTTLKIFNALGIVISFVDDVRLVDTNVINPDWITRGVYGVLNDPQVKNVSKGEFNIQDLGSILNLVEFPVHRHPYLVDIMKKFKICYAIAGDDDKYIIPDLLEDIEPSIVGIDPPKLEFFIDYNQFLCHSIMINLIVSLHDVVYDGKVWRTGAFLKLGENICKIWMPYTKNAINITVYGSDISARDAFICVREEIRKIHRSYESLEFKEELLYRKHRFPYEVLLSS